MTRFEIRDFRFEIEAQKPQGISNLESRIRLLFVRERLLIQIHRAQMGAIIF